MKEILKAYGDMVLSVVIALGLFLSLHRGLQEAAELMQRTDLYVQQECTAFSQSLEEKLVQEEVEGCNILQDTMRYLVVGQTLSLSTLAGPEVDSLTELRIRRIQGPQGEILNREAEVSTVSFVPQESGVYRFWFLAIDQRGRRREVLRLAIANKWADREEENE